MRLALTVTSLASEPDVVARATLVTAGPTPASATIELHYPCPCEALEWITSRRWLRADAERLLAAVGIERTGAQDLEFRERVRTLMRELWQGLTGRPLDGVVLHRDVWRSLTRPEREILRAQWYDGLGVEVEESPGHPESRRCAIGWDGWLVPIAK